MELNAYQLSTLKTIGHRDDMKECWAARDRHFDCLDAFNESYDNNYKCPNTYESWRKWCNPGVRNVQVDTRMMQKRDQTLYTQEKLDDYNSRKNIKIWEKPKNFNFA